MEEKGYIEVKIDGKVGNKPLKSIDIDIAEIKEIISDVETFLYPTRGEKAERPHMSYKIEDGSARNLFYLPISGVLLFNGLSTEIKTRGTNLFFAVYWNADKQKRVYETIPFNVVIEHQKWRAKLSKVEKTKTPIIPLNPLNGDFLFTLSPNDLVYLPPNEAEENDSKNIDPQNIYKVVSFTGSECFFIPNYVASLIKNYEAKSKIGEFGSLNKQEISIDLIVPQRIKEYCIKIDVNRLGRTI